MTLLLGYDATLHLSMGDEGFSFPLPIDMDTLKLDLNRLQEEIRTRYIVRDELSKRGKR